MDSNAWIHRRPAERTGGDKTKILCRPDGTWAHFSLSCLDGEAADQLTRLDLPNNPGRRISMDPGGPNGPFAGPKHINSGNGPRNTA
jgi:hypothetical protein